MSDARSSGPPIGPPIRRFVVLAAALFLGCCAAGFLRADPAAPAGSDGQLAVYSEKIRPLLAERCFSCHGGLKQEAGLRLDTVELMAQGGESGAVISKGDPDASLVLERVMDPEPASRMPPEGEGEPLSAEQVTLLKSWIAAGCPAPADEKPEADPRDHWAFQPRVRPPVPAVKNSAWVRNPIDAWIAADHEKAGLVPQPEAPRGVLVRRLFLDLVGLPPAAEELAAIEGDASPDWYEKLVEKLLADPRHGERWGRHWMDIWRYSDWWGLGSELRNSQKHMWHWRDWIVESLNADTPYDEMVRQMLAADEIYPTDPAKLRATGFLARNWFLFNRTPWMDETVEHVGKSLLGLTMNCSKCHAHKYDPIQQEDYYKMRAFFEPIHVRLDVVPGEADLEKNGLPRVFDGLPDAPTYLFVRGEDTKPDKSRSIPPGVPEVLGFGEIVMEPVKLPKEAFQPERQPWVFDANLATVRRDVEAAEKRLATAIEKQKAAKEALAALEEPSGASPSPASPPSALPPAPGGFVEDFAALDAGRWRTLDGTWRHETGRLLQEQVGAKQSAARLVSAPPRDFDATVRFTITGGNTYRSVGLAFDIGPDDAVGSQVPVDGEFLVYASGVAVGSKVQVAQHAKGAWQYPGEAMQARSVEVGVPHTLRVAVRDTLVNVWFDGEPVIVWRSSMPRRGGGLQIITFDATAVFEDFSIAPLAADTVLREPAAASATVEAARRQLASADAGVELGRAALAAKKAAVESVQRRIDATRIGWEAEAATEEATALRERQAEAAKAAVRAEREWAVAISRQKLAEFLDLIANAKPDETDRIARLEKSVAEARKQVEKDVKSVGAVSEAFTPVRGARWTPTRFRESRTDDATIPFPEASTGRRTALARWITDPRNPLPARVAANHIWNRHIGRPLVATVFDFGRKGNAPTHPGLLDWLASELVEGPPGGTPWSMKHLHRLIVTSATYRMGSSVAGAAGNLAIDPDNRLLWRRQPIRIESQVVRDCILALAGTLDPAIGGPSVPSSEQAKSRRRSLYFFHSDVERDLFLTTFDDATVKECYQREQSIVPQQALALSNAGLVHDSAAQIAERLSKSGGEGMSDAQFVDRVFLLLLDRKPRAGETEAALKTMALWRSQEAAQPAPAEGVRAHLVWAIFNHNDFVTLR